VELGIPRCVADRLAHDGDVRESVARDDRAQHQPGFARWLECVNTSSIANFTGEADREKPHGCTDIESEIAWGEAIRAVWDSGESKWRVTTRSGSTYRVSAVISALGQLSQPNLPNVPGRDIFAGPAFHSARWNDRVDLAGKRVGVIGSAASAIQIIPEVAKSASRVSVFQRTPNWVIPRSDYPISSDYKALLKTAPHVAKLARQVQHEEAEYLTWQGVAYTEIGRAAIQTLALNHLHYQIADPMLRAKLTPDYPLGATFAGRAWSEPTLLRLAYAFEQASHARRMPAGTPALDRP